jgi:hypothetical protein
MLLSDVLPPGDAVDDAHACPRSNGRTGEYKNFVFRERCDLSGLQCVDVLAWSRSDT